MQQLSTIGFLASDELAAAAHKCAHDTFHSASDWEYPFGVGEVQEQYLNALAKIAKQVEGFDKAVIELCIAKPDQIRLIDVDLDCNGYFWVVSSDIYYGNNRKEQVNKIVETMNNFEEFIKESLPDFDGDVELVVSVEN